MNLTNYNGYNLQTVNNKQKNNWYLTIHESTLIVTYISQACTCLERKKYMHLFGAFIVIFFFPPPPQLNKPLILIWHWLDPHCHKGLRTLTCIIARNSCPGFFRFKFRFLASPSIRKTKPKLSRPDLLPQSTGNDPGAGTGSKCGKPTCMTFLSGTKDIILRFTYKASTAQRRAFDKWRQ